MGAYAGIAMDVCVCLGMCTLCTYWHGCMCRSDMAACADFHADMGVSENMTL